MSKISQGSGGKDWGVLFTQACITGARAKFTDNVYHIILLHNTTKYCQTGAYNDVGGFSHHYVLLKFDFIKKKKVGATAIMTILLPSQ